MTLTMRHVTIALWLAYFLFLAVACGVMRKAEKDEMREIESIHRRVHSETPCDGNMVFSKPE